MKLEVYRTTPGSFEMSTEDCQDDVRTVPRKVVAALKRTLTGKPTTSTSLPMEAIRRAQTTKAKTTRLPTLEEEKNHRSLHRQKETTTKNPIPTTSRQHRQKPGNPMNNKYEI